MTIILSSTQSDISTGGGFGSLLREFGGAAGMPDLLSSAGGAGQRGGSAALNAMSDAVGGLLNRLYGNNQEKFDKSFVGSGRAVIAGGGSIAGGKVSPLEDASVLQVTNQTPNLSVLVKKRAFASLNHLYDPTLMDDGELWLFRATKRLFARKCAEVADYERLSKIKRLAEQGSSAVALAGLMTGFAAEWGAASSTFTATTGAAGPSTGADSGVGFFTSMRNLEKAVKDRQPVDVTTWFYDPDVPFEPRMGSGSGVFEITLVSSLNTNLSIDGTGNCSFSLDNPYNILRITEHDIEMALRDTALSKLVSVLDKAAGLALANAQTADAQLTKARKDRKRSAISFTVSVSGQGTTGTVDAIGVSLTANNLDLVPEPHSLDSSEKSLVKRILKGLDAYSMATRRNLLDGLSVSGSEDATLKESMEYSRKLMRKFYMGKLLVQPMDAIHIFIDGQARRSGETSDLNSGQTDIVGAIGNALGLQETWQIDEPLLKTAWEKSGKWLTFEDFKKLYSVSGAGGMHVFGGLVVDATSSYNAENGRYEVSVSANSNMEWLRLSRYNQQPALQQTEGNIWDPLTPFKFDVDGATGLPTGRPILSDTNQKLLDSGIFLHRGRSAGKRVTSGNADKLLWQDIQVNGASLVPIYEMPPGLKYRWKEGIITTTYTASAVNPLDPTLVNERQLRRDIGFFAANTAFDTMDAANIVSLLVTGYPHNTATFIESALNAGAFQLDTTLNSGKDYFHSFLDVQKSINLVQGNFSPFKIINADRRDLAEAIATQQRLTGTSATLKQKKNQYATFSDQILKYTNALPKGRTMDPSDKARLDTLYDAQKKAARELEAAMNDFDDLLNSSDEPLWRIAGDDVGFDLTNPADAEEAKLFGDRFLFVAQRRREDTIYNKDKNFLIVSEDYDKDFDIQAFALKMRDQAPNTWKNTWDDVYQLCKRAAEALDLEFFCNTQGHLELRPPQYNRTPLTVLSTMLALNQNAGIKVFPDFLTKLVSSRAQNLITDIAEAEYEMMRWAALLGATDFTEAKQKIFGGSSANSGASAQFLVELGDSAAAIAKNQAMDEGEKRRLQEFVSAGTGLAARGSAIFSAGAQANLVRTMGSKATTSSGSEDFYKFAVKELVKLTGRPLRSYPDFEEVRIGSKRNGQSNPASDLSQITDRIAEQVGRRSKLLRVLEKVLEQSVEIASVNSGGQVQTGLGWLNSSTEPSALFENMIENDAQNVLGHLSGKRFIIGDENLISYRLSEKAPELTICSVSGSADALAGVQEGLYSGGTPAAKAIGADFDLWRQYGFRQDKNFDKPYFYDSELQCAPYAKMILTRQHKEILSAEAEVVGNEFYQLGDVVYLSDLQMLFYVYAVRHSFTYENGFSTTLTLKYGRPPGEYIPTPLDVIGKSLSNRANLQTGFRTRRLPPRSDRVLGTVRFSSGETGMNGLIGGQDGARNCSILSNALLLAKKELRPDSPDTSQRVVVIAFGNASNRSDQEGRIGMVQKWLTNPTMPGEKSDTFSATTDASTGSADLAKSALSNDMILTERLAQMAKDADLEKTDLELLKAGVAASDQSWTLDPTLDTVVEIRLRPAPAGGWSKAGGA